MVLFSIVCLVIIVLGIQHLLSWLWRKSHREDVLPFIATILSGIATFFLIRLIIQWGQALL